MSDDQGQGGKPQKVVDAFIGAVAMAVLTLAVFAPMYTTGAMFDTFPVPAFADPVLRVITIVELGLVALVCLWGLFEGFADVGKDIRSIWGEFNE